MTDHGRSDCKVPVTSCGIICVTKIDDIPYILLVQRKDSLAFPEFVRMKYLDASISRFIRPHYMQLLVSTMTPDERVLLASGDFDAICRRVYPNAHVAPKKKQVQCIKKSEIVRARDQYERLCKSTANPSIQYLVENSANMVAEPEWGFPKGRRAPQEDDLQCALRETYEETGYKSDVLIVKPEHVYSEIVIGTNGVKYLHKYYMAIADPRLVSQCVEHRNHEVRSVQWFTSEEAMKKIPQKSELIARCISDFLTAT